MALNTSRCNYLTPLGLKGLNIRVSYRNRSHVTLQTMKLHIFGTAT